MTPLDQLARERGEEALGRRAVVCVTNAASGDVPVAVERVT
jgi:hypothetical protein